MQMNLRSALLWALMLITVCCTTVMWADSLTAYCTDSSGNPCEHVTTPVNPVGSSYRGPATWVESVDNGLTINFNFAIDMSHSGFQIGNTGYSGYTYWDNGSNPTVSDLIYWYNDPSTGLGVLKLVSGGLSNSNPLFPGVNLLSLEGCVEDIQNNNGQGGCISSFDLFVGGGPHLVVTGSDGSGPFWDAFGSGHNTSDGISMDDVTPVDPPISETPEPATVSMFGFGAAILARRIRKLR